MIGKISCGWMTTARRAKDYAQVNPENRKVGIVFITAAIVSHNLILFQVIFFVLIDSPKNVC
jgi:hypothetical protein